jgi:hypothetical protein
MSNIRRGMLFNLHRIQLKVLICVCIYNEQAKAISLTMEGIYKNLEHMRTILNITED